jgi:hypothetical protein
VFLSKPIKESEDRRNMALKIWDTCATVNGSLGELYLRSRGYHESIPSMIRFHPKLYHEPSKMYLPALVAAVIRWPNETICGIHRTYLNGPNKASKLPNKMMLGSTQGGAVRLSSSVGPHLLLTEGIETGLSTLLSTKLSTWATLSTSGMMNVIVPSPSMTPKITIAADNDNAGRVASKTLAQRLTQEGHEVYIALPPENTDFNDVLRG